MPLHPTCIATTRSRAKSCTEVSGSFTSCRNRLSRSPPTQYSRMSHRWLVVSYLWGGGRDTEHNADLAPEREVAWVARTSRRGPEAHKPRDSFALCCHAPMRGAAPHSIIFLPSPPSPLRLPCEELEHVLVVQGMHGPHLRKYMRPPCHALMRQCLGVFWKPCMRRSLPSSWRRCHGSGGSPCMRKCVHAWRSCLSSMHTSCSTRAFWSLSTDLIA